MKYSNSIQVIVLLCLLAIGCEPEYADYDDECDVNWGVGEGVYKFVCPYSVSPIQQTYQRGDTITFLARFSDTIYDEGSQRSYYLPDFPFRSTFTLWWITDRGTVESGLRHCHWEIDSLVTDHRYVTNSGLISDHVAFRYFGQESSTGPGYFFMASIVCDSAGVYMIQAEDLIRQLDNPVASLSNYDFECKHPTTVIYNVVNRVSHDDHLDNYDEELQLIVDEAFGGRYKTSTSMDGIKVALRQEASYAFEVRE